MTKTDISIYDFIQARIEDGRQSTEGLIYPGIQFVNQVLHSFEMVLDMHKQWPTIVQSPPKFESSLDDSFANTMTMRVSQEMDFLIHSEYVKRFGMEPPTTLMLRSIATVWGNHPDFNPDWVMSKDEYRKSLGLSVKG